MSTTIESGEKAKHDFLILHVRYLGAHRPFVDDGALPTETLAELKPKVLEFFTLSEQGGKTYTFSRDDTPLTNMSETLAQLASGKHELKLKLVEQFEQG